MAEEHFAKGTWALKMDCEQTSWMPAWGKTSLLYWPDLLSGGRYYLCLPGYLLYMGSSVRKDRDRRNQQGSPLWCPMLVIATLSGRSRRVLDLKPTWASIARLILKANKTKAMANSVSAQETAVRRTSQLLGVFFPCPPHHVSPVSQLWVTEREPVFLRSKRKLDNVSEDVFWEHNIQSSKEIHRCTMDGKNENSLLLHPHQNSTEQKTSSQRTLEQNQELTFFLCI